MSEYLMITTAKREQAERIARARAHAVAREIRAGRRAGQSAALAASRRPRARRLHGARTPWAWLSARLHHHDAPRHA